MIQALELREVDAADAYQGRPLLPDQLTRSGNDMVFRYDSTDLDDSSAPDRHRGPN